jgi:hypothetical protein
VHILLLFSSISIVPSTMSGGEHIRPGSPDPLPAPPPRHHKNGYREDRRHHNEPEHHCSQSRSAAATMTVASTSSFMRRDAATSFSVSPPFPHCNSPSMSPSPSWHVTQSHPFVHRRGPLQVALGRDAIPFCMAHPLLRTLWTRGMARR